MPASWLVNALEVEVKLLREMLDAVHEDRNARREQASKMVAAIPPPTPAPLCRSAQAVVASTSGLADERRATRPSCSQRCNRGHGTLV